MGCNAAGYDGFGLARYSALAGDMKLWGDLDDPRKTLSGEGRALDLLGVPLPLGQESGARAGVPLQAGRGPAPSS